MVVFNYGPFLAGLVHKTLDLIAGRRHTPLLQRSDIDRILENAQHHLRVPFCGAFDAKRRAVLHALLLFVGQRRRDSVSCQSPGDVNAAETFQLPTENVANHIRRIGVNA